MGKNVFVSMAEVVNMATLSIMLFVSGTVPAGDEWYKARATFYGDPSAMRLRVRHTRIAG